MRNRETKTLTTGCAYAGLFSDFWFPGLWSVLTHLPDDADDPALDLDVLGVGVEGLHGAVGGL